MAPAPCLVVRVRADAAEFLVRLEGELDISNRHLVTEACAAGRDRPVVVDLSLLTFMDCGGYGTLIAADLAAVASGGSFVVRHRIGQPAHLLQRLTEIRQALATAAETVGAPAPV